MASRTPGTPGNIAGFSAIGFGVGNPDFLNSAASKVQAYYREIEFGTTRFVGRRIYGLFGDEAGPRGGLINGTLTPFGGRVDQKFVPFAEPETNPVGGRRAAAYLRRQEKIKGDQAAGAVSGIIKREIVAQKAYAKAAAAFNPLEQERTAIQEAFSQTFTDPSSALSGRGRQRKTAGAASFKKRSGLQVTFTLSGFQTSLQKVDQAFITELTNANKILALRLADKVAEEQDQLIKRRLVSSGRLVSATLDPANRFPS